VEAYGRRKRRGPCPCERGAPLAACCLPWEEAFQRLAARLIRHGEGLSLRPQYIRAAAVFWNTEPPRRPPAHGVFGGRLHFLEWLLHEYEPSRQSGSPLARFADEASGLAPEEEALLLALLLAPMRLYEVTEPRGWRGVVLRDVLAGTEQTLGPLALRVTPIRSDLLIARLLPVGRLLRPGLSMLQLPGTAREELLAYLRTAYRLTQTGRHVAFEDFLDGSTYLYHHFHLLRGRGMGGRVEATTRPFAFAPREVVYRGLDAPRIRAVLDRQPDLEPGPGPAGERSYAWIDRASGCVRGSLELSPRSLRVRADTGEDATEIRRHAEEWLRGLLVGEPTEDGPPAASEWEPPGEAEREPAGRRFLRRMLGRWTDAPHPALGDRSPQAACGSRRGREQVETLVAALERDLARCKRQGRAWADVAGVREVLGLGPAPAAPGGR
jgi:hypothetical protein